MPAESAGRVAFVVLCGCASLAAGGGSATRTPCAFASLGGCGWVCSSLTSLGWVGRFGHRRGLSKRFAYQLGSGYAVRSPPSAGLSGLVTGVGWADGSRTSLGWVVQLAHELGLGSAVRSPASVGLGSSLTGLGSVRRSVSSPVWAGSSSSLGGFGLGWTGRSPAWVGLGGQLTRLAWVVTQSRTLWGLAGRSRS